MSYKSVLVRAGIAALLGVLGGGAAISATQDKHMVKVTEGPAVSEFRGYENWEAIAVSHNGELRKSATTSSQTTREGEFFSLNCNEKKS